MSEEQKQENTNNKTAENQASNVNAFDDDGINSIIAEVEKDLESKNNAIETNNKKLVEQVYTNLKAKLDTKVQSEIEAKNQEIENLKAQIKDNSSKMDANKQATEEAVKKIVEEYQKKFSNIDNKLTQGSTQIENQGNPFKPDNNKKADPYQDLASMDIPEDEKVKLFYKYIRGQ